MKLNNWLNSLAIFAAPHTPHQTGDTADLSLKYSIHANHVPLCLFSLSGPSTDGHIGVLQVRAAHRGLLPGSPAPAHEQGLWAPVPGPRGAGGTRTLRRPIRWPPSFRACSPSVRHPHPTAVSRRWTRPCRLFSSLNVPGGRTLYPRNEPTIRLNQRYMGQCDKLQTLRRGQDRLCLCREVG